MKLNLSENRKINYSNRERAVFSALPKNGKEISTLDLAKIVFKEDERFNARQLIVGAIRSLKMKIAYNKEPFIIKSSGHQGPHCMTVWLENKK